MKKAFVGFVVVLASLIAVSFADPIFQLGMAVINGLAVIQ